MSMKRYDPATVHEPTSYSHAIELPKGARVVHISGQVGVSPEGRLMPDFAAQAEQAFRNLAAVLKEAGRISRPTARSAAGSTAR
jgi:enamine deaminase RidA (YjgF/YER057c/UK114 family)